MTGYQQAVSKRAHVAEKIRSRRTRSARLQVASCFRYSILHDGSNLTSSFQYLQRRRDAMLVSAIRPKDALRKLEGGAVVSNTWFNVFRS